MRRTRPTLLTGLVGLAGCSIPAVPSTDYAFAPRSAATSAGEPIDLDQENRAVSAWLRSLPEAEFEARPLIVVPGYSPLDDSRAEAVSQRSRERLELARAAFAELDGLAILVTGGNVHPPDTPFNEAFGMKRYLIDHLGVPADRIALEPYARHTTTNLRNSGRFMLAHDIAEAVVVSTRPQSFYIAFGAISSFRARCQRELGYEVGELEALSAVRTRFVPAALVTRRGRDPLDP